MMYFKVLGKNRMPYHGGSGQWLPGGWMPAVEVDPCNSGYHLCEAKDLLTWLGPEIWLAKGRGRMVGEGNKVVFEQARLVRRLPWNDRTARLFAADCAEHVLHIYEEKYSNDDRPRQAIEVARRYANGEATGAELSAAQDAARSAARDAAEAAGWAAWAAAWAAAWDAAWAAAWDAAEREWQTAKLLEYLEL